MKRYCKCVGWSEAWQCRDGVSWDAEGMQYQAHPPGAVCRCMGDCCYDNCQCAVQEVPPVGTFLVADGVTRRVANSFYGTEGRLSIEMESGSDV